MYHKDELDAINAKIKDAKDPDAISVLALSMCNMLATNMAETGSLLAKAVDALVDLTIATMDAFPDPDAAPKAVADAAVKALAFIKVSKEMYVLTTPTPEDK